MTYKTYYKKLFSSDFWLNLLAKFLRFFKTVDLRCPKIKEFFIPGHRKSEYGLNLLAKFLRFFIRKNPVGYFAPTFNKKYPYWSAAISAITIVVLVLSTVWFGFFSGGKEVEAAWWNDSWAYRKPIDITNASGSDLTAFQVKVLTNVDLSTDISSGKVKSDLGDLRFTDINGELLPYWIEDSTAASVDAWVKADSVPSAGATIYMYYGNSSAGSAANGNDVFLFFDDFNNSSLDSKWTYAEGATPAVDDYSESGGALQITSDAAVDMEWLSGSYANLPRVYGSISNTDIEISAKITTNNLDTDYKRIGLLILQDTDNGVSVLRSWSDEFGYNGNNVEKYKFDAGSRTFSAISSTKNNPEYLKIKRTGNTFEYFVSSDRNSWTSIGTYSKTMTANYIGMFTGDGGINSFDDFYACKSVSTNPVASTPGTEEKGTGPIAYWSFDEGYGTTANDETTNKNNGTLTNMSATASSTSGWQTEDNCVAGKCLAFDGINDRATIANESNFDFERTQAFSLGLWVKTTATGSNVPLINKGTLWGSGWEMQVQAGLVAMYVNGVGVNVIGKKTTNAVNDGKWHYIFSTYDGSSAIGGIKIYIDGVEASTTTLYAGPLTTTTLNNESVIIGYTPGWGTYLNGKIDEPKIYNYARSAAQIKMDYNAGLAGTSGRAAGEGTAVSIGKRSPAWLSNGLVGWWKMDEAASPAVDSSGNGNSGTWTGTAASASGKFGNSISLDGDSDYVDIASVSALPQGAAPRTYTAWVYPTADSNADTIIDSGHADTNNENERFCISRVSNEIYMCGQVNDINGTLSIPNNQWSHVVATYDGTTVKLYVNAALDPASAVKTLNTNGTKVRIGNYRRADSAEYFPGKIDDVRIYNRALSDREVKDLYSYAPGPVAEWRFEEGSGQYAYDSSGNGYAATLGGSTAANANDPTWATGKSGKALKFDGSKSQYLLTSSSINGSAGWNFSSWIYITGGQGTRRGIISHYYSESSCGYELEIGTNNKLYFSHAGTGCIPTDSGNSVTGSATLATDTWYHVAGSVSPTAVSLYINGALDATAAANNVVDLTYPFVIGGFDETRFYFTGLMDDIKIYNYARTQEQIMEDMNARGSTAEGGGNTAAVSATGKTAIGYWKFDEGQGTTAYDSSPQKNNGTLTNMASPATATSGWNNSGKFSRALSFDGSDDYVDMGNSSTFQPSSFTASALVYVKGNSGGTYQGILTNSVWGDYYGYALAVNANNQLYAVVQSASAGTFTTGNGLGSGAGYQLQNNTWYHVTVTYTSTALTLYVNGAQAAQKTPVAIAYEVSDRLILGTWAGSPAANAYFNGLVDEVKIYNFALTADDIKAEYNQGSSLKLGSFSTDSNGVASSSAASLYCVPGSTDACSPPVGEWKFEEGSGTTANDTSGNGNVGTLTNGPTWTTGKSGKAVKFDGVNDSVIKSGFSSGITNSASYELWVRPSANGANGAQQYDFSVMMGKDGAEAAGGDLKIGYRSDNKVRVYIENMVTMDSLDSVNAIPINQWTYLTVTEDGTTLKLYINGKLESQKSFAANFNINQIGIGASYLSTWSSYFNGLIDEARVYNYARTPAQVAWDYNRGGPVGWWKMDECSGTVIHDSSGFGNNGAWSGTGGGTQTAVGTCTTSGTAWYNGATGKRNASLNFDGSDDYVGMSGSLIPAQGNPFTVSIWFTETAQTNDFRELVSQWGSNNDMFIGVRTYDNIRVSDNWDNIDVGTWATASWHHLLVLSTPSNAYVYFDGVLKATKGSALSYTSTGNFVIGKQGAYSGPEYWNGQIDDVQIFNYALTPIQIKTLFSGGAVNFR